MPPDDRCDEDDDKDVGSMATGRELALLQRNFDEYIESSRELEQELESEMLLMQRKQSEMTATNEALTSQLEAVTSQVSTLERALARARESLEEESRLRRRAELAQDEAECKARAMEGTVAALREENDGLHEELAFRGSEMEELRGELDDLCAGTTQTHTHSRLSPRAAEGVTATPLHPLPEEEDEDATAAEPATPSSTSTQHQHHQHASEHSSERRQSPAEPQHANINTSQPNQSAPATDATQQHSSPTPPAPLSTPSSPPPPPPPTSPPPTESDEYIKNLEDELELVTEQLIDAQAQLTQTQVQNTQLHASHQKSLQNTLQEELDTLRATTAAQEQELQLTQEELQLTQEELEVVQMEAQQKLSAAQKEVDQVQGDLQQVKEELHGVKEECSRLEQVNKSSLSKEKTLESSLDKLQHDFSQVTRQLEEQQQALKNSPPTPLQLPSPTTPPPSTDATSPLRKELSNTKNRLHNAETEATQLRQEISTLESRHADAKRQLGAMRSSLTATKADLTKARAEVKKLQQQQTQQGSPEREKHRGKTATMSSPEGITTTSEEKEVRRLGRKLSELTKENASLKEQVESVRKRVKKEQSSISTTITPVNAHAHGDASTVTTMASTKTGLTVATTVSPPSMSSSSVNELEEHLKRLQEEKEEDCARVRQLQAKIDSLEGQLRQVQKARTTNHQQGIAQKEAESESCMVSPTPAPLLIPPPPAFSPAAIHSPRYNLDEQDDEDDAMAQSRLVLQSQDPILLSTHLRKATEQCRYQREHNAQLLHRILALQGNIQVCARIRPMRQEELAKGLEVVVEPLSETEVGCLDLRQAAAGSGGGCKSKVWKSFAFDRVWGPDQGQSQVFQDVEPLALSVVDGYNACIFAYGQTGSGKTYTMEGVMSDKQYGISQRTVQKIFHLLHMREQRSKAVVVATESSSSAEQDTLTDAPTMSGEEKAMSVSTLSSASASASASASPHSSCLFSFSMQVGMLEIYNDEVYDLLSTEDSANIGHENHARAGAPYHKPSLDVRRDQDGRVVVPGLTAESVHCLDDVMNLLRRGNANRATASTNLNEHSSRSHMVLNVRVSSGSPGQQNCTGHLYLVDLAGSERVRKSAVEGKELREAQHINKSLSALGDVMEALDRKASHIPFRNSKLTYLLQDCLGGNSRTMMVATINPGSDSAHETMCALQFATRVRRINLGAAQRNVSTKNQEERIKNLTEEVRAVQRAKERSDEQLQSVRRERQRIEDQLANIRQSRLKDHDDARAMTVLRKSHEDMKSRYDKEKALLDRRMNELENCQKELRLTNQKLLRASRERDHARTLLEEKEKALFEANRELRMTKDSLSAANLRARRSQLMQSGPKRPVSSSTATSPASSRVKAVAGGAAATPQPKTPTSSSSKGGGNAAKSPSSTKDKPCSVITVDRTAKQPTTREPRSSGIKSPTRYRSRSISKPGTPHPSMGKEIRSIGRTGSMDSSEDQKVAAIREKLLVLFQKYEPQKVKRLDAILEKFKGREAVLLERVTARHESDSMSEISSLDDDGSGSVLSSGATPTTMDTASRTRQQLAIAKHKERMLKRRKMRQTIG